MTTAPAALRPTANPGVPLSALFPGTADVPVTGVSLDSRQVRSGDLYVALAGQTTHGARFGAQALAAGAVAVLTDEAGAQQLAGSGVPVVAVADPRTEMARLAVEVYGRPGERLSLFGVTGTTGKTSTTFLLTAALEAAGRQVGTIGTIGFTFAGRQLAAPRTTVTTPESPDLQALLALLAELGADSVAMEVSSHALALHRVDGLVFDVAAFTNLGRDHLDFHPDQEHYFQAKAALFRDGRCRSAVVNIDDEYGRRLAGELRADPTIRLVTTGRSAPADFHPLASEPGTDGRSQVRLATPSGEFEFTLGLLGDFNVRNATTATAILDVAGIDLPAALPGFADAFVPGRMQRVDLGPGAPGVVVDFAHTPESVGAALAALPAGRRVAVLGCGGDRDQAKRGPMGAAAAEGANVVVVTDDNPRSEDPAVDPGSGAGWGTAGSRGQRRRGGRRGLEERGDRARPQAGRTGRVGGGAWQGSRDRPAPCRPDRPVRRCRRGHQRMGPAAGQQCVN